MIMKELQDENSVILDDPISESIPVSVVQEVSEELESSNKSSNNTKKLQPNLEIEEYSVENKDQLPGMKDKDDNHNYKALQSLQKLNPDNHLSNQIATIPYRNITEDQQNSSKRARRNPIIPRPINIQL